MSPIDNRFFLDILKREVVPATGCTEPIAVALAVAKAREILNQKPTHIKVLVSPNIFKNGMGVGIPGTGKVGLFMAAALGAVYGHTVQGLELLQGVTPGAIAEANSLVADTRVCIEIQNGMDKLYVEAICSLGENQARACIKGSHSNFVLTQLNQTVLEGALSAIEPAPAALGFVPLVQMSVAQIYRFATSAPFSELEFMIDGAEMNLRIAQEGLTGDYGLKIGKSIRQRVDQKLMAEDLLTHCLALTTAASDARMAGHTLPAMSNSGSGNQGIAVIIPVAAAAQKLNSSREELARALAMSNLVAIHIKNQMGRLGALCGVAAAAAAAACGIVFLMGGQQAQMEHAVKNVVGNLTGMICDGAKVGCSLKVSTAVSACVNSAFLAMDNICVQQTDGIVSRDVEATIRNFAQIGSDGMAETDKLILNLMLNK